MDEIILMRKLKRKDEWALGKSLIYIVPISHISSGNYCIKRYQGRYRGGGCRYFYFPMADSRKD